MFGFKKKQRPLSDIERSAASVRANFVNVCTAAVLYGEALTDAHATLSAEYAAALNSGDEEGAAAKWAELQAGQPELVEARKAASLAEVMLLNEGQKPLLVRV